MGAHDLLSDLTDREAPRRLFNVAPALDDPSLNLTVLLQQAHTAGVTKQLGYFMDLCLERELITSTNPQYRNIMDIRDTLFNEREHSDTPFYPEKEEALLEYKRNRRSPLLKRWGLIAVIDEEACVQHYHANRQNPTK